MENIFHLLGYIFSLVFGSTKATIVIILEKVEFQENHRHLFYSTEICLNFAHQLEGQV